MSERVRALQARLDTVNAYKELFLEEGKLRGDARLFFADLAKFCGTGDAALMVSQSGTADPIQHVFRDGKRSVFEHINTKLSEDPVVILDAIQRETDES